MKHIVKGGILAVAIGVLSVSQAAAQNVQTHRGGEADTMSVTMESGVQVVRGPAIVSEPQAPDAHASAATTNQYVAGRRLWKINNASGAVSVCRLKKTYRVGLRQVRCYN